MRWRSLLVIPAVIGAALAISLTQGKVVHYPLALQRALSFMPGDWDFMAKRSAEGSSEWRGKMKELFFKEYFPKNPVIGVGYHYNPELAKRDTDIFLSIATRQAQVGDEFADVRSYIVSSTSLKNDRPSTLIKASQNDRFTLNCSFTN